MENKGMDASVLQLVQHRFVSFSRLVAKSRLSMQVFPRESKGLAGVSADMGSPFDVCRLSQKQNNKTVIGNKLELASRPAV